MLTVSREVDYAVRLVVHLATAQQTKFQARTLAEEEKIPESFLFKILQLLIRQRIVRSYRGSRGGYQLAVDPAKLTLYRLLEMVEGPIGMNVCVSPAVGCDLSTQCAVHDVWVTAQAQLRRTLESATIAELARRTGHKRQAALRLRRQSISPEAPDQPQAGGPEG
ncbi:MAG: Rrf2 family transcriptional regulator [Acidobacteria bacterium]|nr:Rrf2 family transcriptional regulator [Acidobacteriota bacterium]